MLTSLSQSMENGKAISKYEIVLCVGHLAKEQLVAYANSCIKPALDYYRVHLDAPMMSVPVSAFKAARLLYSINSER